MRSFFSFMVLLLLYNIACCQATTEKIKHNKQALTVEGLGNSRSIISVNYERIFEVPHKDHFYFTTRTGVGYVPGIKSQNLKGTTSIPVVLSLLYGKKKHFFQMGVGYTLSLGQNFMDSAFSPPVQYLKYESSYIVGAGYRFMEYDGATIEAIPLLIWTNNPSSRFGWSIGLSVGYAF